MVTNFEPVVREMTKMLRKRTKKEFLELHVSSRKKRSFSTFFCFCWVKGFPRGICVSLCTSVNGDSDSREGSLLQGDGFGENRTFARGVLFWFSFSLPPFFSNLEPFVPTCEGQIVIGLITVSNFVENKNKNEHDTNQNILRCKQ